ncbi:MAG: dihydrofolate reductase family protein [Acidobacteriota bacterium]|nr:dihydrofolate reductase family protein [Acidobacteriota bacterium]
MRNLVYYIATTLDGFIARPDGSFDDFPWDDEFIRWLQEIYPETFPAPMRPDATRAENQAFDAVLMGRRTYEVGVRQDLTSPYPTLDQFVLSSTMEQSPDPAVTLVSEDVASFVADLKATPGKDIWLCGGSVLATSLFEAQLVDRVILKLNPVLFGEGIPLLDRRLATVTLTLESSRVFAGGHVLLDYRC